VHQLVNKKTLTLKYTVLCLYAYPNLGIILYQQFSKQAARDVTNA